MTILLLFFIIFIIFYIINQYTLPLSYKIENFEPLETPFPIDIVYTWKGEKQTNDIRSSYNYELKYSLRSVELFAPWVNTIYLLVDAPKKYPSWINPFNKKIVLVDTTETFKDEKYLPNSNSNAIETTIINIPNLSEHYIYFCDDIFLGRHTKYTDFFTIDGKPLVDYKALSHSRNIQNNTLSNDLNFPKSVNGFYPHVPIPLLKSSVMKFIDTYPEYIEWIRMTKKRKGDGCNICVVNDLMCPCQQIHYPIAIFMLSKNNAYVTRYYGDNNKAMFIMNDKLYNNPYLLDNIIKKQPLFYCINDDEEDLFKKQKVRELMLQFFNKYYPNKASFEKY